MSDPIALAILAAVSAYSIVGICFALAFVFRGIHAIDPSAVHAGISVRFMLIPGATALWPLLLQRWVCAGRKP